MRNFFLRIFGGEEVHGHRTLSAWKLGLGFLVIVLIVGWASFNKAQLTTWLTPGENIKVNFAQDYRLRPYFSQAKIGFVPVGKITDIEQKSDGTAEVTMKLFGDNKDKLGSEPSATIRPTTLLGGNYFVDLVPGGDPGAFPSGEIPKERTHLPVELDKLTKALQPYALQGIRGTVAKFDETLQGGGTAALQRLVADAPGSLKPTGEVLQALRGQNPDRDLTSVVNGLEATSRELSQPKGRLESILGDLATTSAVFGRRSADFSATLDELPDALHSADHGLKRLNTTLDVLEDTADDIRPSAHELDKTLDRIDPVLHRARPVVNELRDVLQDARPLVEKLVPDSKDLTRVLEDLRGPVLGRVNGPISNLILNPFHGNGPYAQSETDKPIFEELAYAATNLDRATVIDKNGSSIKFQPSIQPEPSSNVVRNDGQPRVETLQRGLLDQQRINPPIQSPGQAPHSSGGKSGGSAPLIPMLGGDTAHPDKEGR
jgi:phospholipid/cholesterol/gamma-HCH transport system substrate-binding protein